MLFLTKTHGSKNLFLNLLENGDSLTGHAVPNGRCSAPRLSLRRGSKMHAAHIITTGDGMVHFGG